MRKSTVHPHVLPPVAIEFVLVLAASACLPQPSAQALAGPSGTGVPGAPGSATDVPTATSASQAAAEGEDRMTSCHVPGPNEDFATGAVPQPASCVVRAVCLSCHNTLDKPARPATWAVWTPRAPCATGRAARRASQAASIAFRQTGSAGEEPTPGPGSGA